MPRRRGVAATSGGQTVEIESPPRRGAVPLRPVALLIADPDGDAAKKLVVELLAYNIDASVCSDGAEALLRIGNLKPDVLLVAAGLPVVDGATLIRVLRRHQATPVILGVGPDDAGRVTSALADGATACVARPYRLHQILPLLLAGRGRNGAGDLEQMVLEVGALRLDRAAHEVRLRGQVIPMPPREFELLHYLMQHADRVVPRQQIHDKIWGVGYAGETNTLSVHIRRLRHRLGDDPHNPQILRTVRHVGYRLVAPS
jgi:DNA-binding response OmpR family regulator